MKILHLTFEDAKLFPKKTKHSKDFVRVNGVSKRRTDFKDVKLNFEAHITKYQVANIINVLLGKRPVPSFRPVPYKMNNAVMEIAEQSYIKIDTPKVVKSRGSKSAKTYELYEDYITETTLVNKASHNAWVKKFEGLDGNFKYEWQHILRFLGPTEYMNFINGLEPILGYNPTAKPFVDLYESLDTHLGKPALNALADHFLKCKRKPIYYLLTLGKETKKFLANITQVRTTGSNSAYVALSDIEEVYMLSGDIYIPIEEDMLDKMVTNTTTLLDGGIVIIREILDSDDLSESDLIDYELVGDISTKKI